MFLSKTDDEADDYSLSTLTEYCEMQGQHIVHEQKTHENEAKC